MESYLILAFSLSMGRADTRLSEHLLWGKSARQKNRTHKRGLETGGNRSETRPPGRRMMRESSPATEFSTPADISREWVKRRAPVAQVLFWTLSRMPGRAVRKMPDRRRLISALPLIYYSL